MQSKKGERTVYYRRILLLTHTREGIDTKRRKKLLCIWTWRRMLNEYKQAWDSLFVHFSAVRLLRTAFVEVEKCGFVRSFAARRFTRHGRSVKSIAIRKHILEVNAREVWKSSVRSSQFMPANFVSTKGHLASFLRDDESLEMRDSLMSNEFTLRQQHVYLIFRLLIVFISIKLSFRKCTVPW